MPTLCERKTDLSIIVPVYNLERFIQPLLDSLKEQDHGGYTVEHIFVLNRCTDYSEDVIRASRLPCSILKCDIQGCGAARNTGMDAAKGEYIWFMDGDDWLLSDTAVKDALDRAKRDRLDILRIPYASMKFSWLYFSMVWQYLFRREFIDEFRFQNVQPGEDDIFTAEVLQKAGYSRETYMDLPHFDEALYFYNYLREGSNMYRVCVLGETIQTHEG